MNRKTTAAFGFFLIVLVVLLVGCVPEFLNPLPMMDGEKGDPRLLGNWRSTEEGEAGSLTIVAADGAWLRITVTDVKDGGGTETTEYTAFVSKIGEDHFLNVKEIDKPGQKTPSETKVTYALAYYWFDEAGRLGIAIFEQDRVKAMIAAGELSGTVDEKGWIDQVVVDASSEKLAELVARKGAKAFVDQDTAIYMARPTKAPAPHVCGS